MFARRFRPTAAGLLTAAALALRTGSASAQEEPPRSPPEGTAWVIFGTDTVSAELAISDRQRSRGLMDRDEVPDGTGMLFVWDEPSIKAFWMKDTPVSLDLAFLDGDLRVVHIAQMEAETTTLHENPTPALYGLEVPWGWFERHRVRVGDQAVIVLPEGFEPG